MQPKHLPRRLELSAAAGAVGTARSQRIGRKRADEISVARARDYLSTRGRFVQRSHNFLSELTHRHAVDSIAFVREAWATTTLFPSLGEDLAESERMLVPYRRFGRTNTCDLDSILTGTVISIRKFALHFLRAVGGFSLARYVTRKQLRILCYHGFSIGDEYQIAPVMFMRAETFERRMRILKRRRIPVISLNEAVSRFQNRDIANAETVITLDDGWASNLSIGLPILEKYGYPACVYATTEHFAAGPEVFNVAVSYMIRRSGRQTFTFEGLHPALDGTYHLGKDPDGVIRAFLVAAEGALSLVERQKLLGYIAASLGLDPSEVLSNDRFRLLTPGEFQELSRRGVDVQLHTHTHHLPDSGFETMAEEIEKNREALRKVIDTVPRHFCYPSGEYSEQHPSWLKKLGIVSATTCDPGLNGADASVMLMKRFVDSDQAADIDFDAEICGVREILRRVRARARHFLEVGAA